MIQQQVPVPATGRQRKVGLLNPLQPQLPGVEGRGMDAALTEGLRGERVHRLPLRAR